MEPTVEGLFDHDEVGPWMLRPKRPDGDVGEPRKQAGSVAAVRVGALRFDRPRPRRRSPVPRTFGGEEARGQAPVRCSTSSRLRAGEAQVRPRTSACKGSPEMKDAPVRRRGNRARAQRAWRRGRWPFGVSLRCGAPVTERAADPCEKLWCVRCSPRRPRTGCTTGSALPRAAPQSPGRTTRRSSPGTGVGWHRCGLSPPMD